MPISRTSSLLFKKLFEMPRIRYPTRTPTFQSKFDTGTRDLFQFHYRSRHTSFESRIKSLHFHNENPKTTIKTQMIPLLSISKPLHIPTSLRSRYNRTPPRSELSTRSTKFAYIDSSVSFSGTRSTESNADIHNMSKQ